MFPGHPGHLANTADLGHRAGHHDPRHPLCLQVGHQHHRAGLQHHQAGRHLQHFQLSLQAAGPGEGDEQGKLKNLSILGVWNYCHIKRIVGPKVVCGTSIHRINL